MTFCTVSIRIGFPENLVIDTGMAGLVTWFRGLDERLGDSQKVAMFEQIEVPGDLVIELLRKTRGQFQHRGIENETRLSVEGAARLFKTGDTYTVELFEV